MTILFWMYRLAFQFALVLFKFFGGESKLGQGLKMRKPNTEGVVPWLAGKTKNRPIWIHCASGEFEYAKPVLQTLKQQHPDVSILVTYFSPSVAYSVRANPLVDFSCPAPWDTPWSIGAFLQYHKPIALLIAKTDVWPEMTWGAAKAKIPILLFSATLTKKSGRMSLLGRPFSKLALTPVTSIFCTSSSDRENFIDLGFGEKTTIEGDTRFDQVFLRLSERKPFKYNLFVSNLPTVMAGSTWSEDEKEIIIAVKDLQNHLRFCIVPHEPTPRHLRDLCDKLKAENLTYGFYSKLESWQQEDVLILDQIGILAEAYSVAQFAFVGGSFRKSVHSVMEALACGCRTFVGPLHENNREAQFFKSKLIHNIAIVQAVDSGAQMSELIKITIASDTSPGMTVKEQIITEVRKQCGATKAVVEWLETNALERPPLKPGI